MKVMAAAAVVLSLGIATGLPASAAVDAGPAEWTQYRLHADKNAVLTDPQADGLGNLVYQTKDEVRATPVVVGDRMFVGNHNTGDLFAFDLTTGKEIWSNQAPNWIHSEMIYHDGTVYVGYGNRFPQDNGEYRGTGQSGVLALDAETGVINWQFPTKGEVMPTPVYANGSLYAVTGGFQLFELDPVTGAQRKSLDIGSAVSMSSPALDDGVLYFGTGHPPPDFEFLAYDTRRGELKWRTEFPDVQYGVDDVPPAVADGVVVTTGLEDVPAGQPREDGEFVHVIYALDQQTGEILWKDPFGKGKPGPNNKSGAPMIYDGKIFVGSPTTRTFYAYDLHSGKRLWEHASGVVKGAPVARDNVVYYGNAEGTIQALDTATGKDQGSKRVGGTLAPAGPILVNDTLLVGSQDSNVYAVPLQDITGIPARTLLLWGGALAVVVLLAAGAGVLVYRRRKS